MKTEYAIIGGGVAGLSAAIRLTELGKKPIIIEGGSYPSHKVCGEFLSPESLCTLKRWNVDPIAIAHTRIATEKRHLTFTFPSAAGGLSHLQLDPALLKYATDSGAQILTMTKVTAFHPKNDKHNFHLIHLSNDEIIEAENVIIAAGRFASSTGKPPPMRYMGFKTHFNHLSINSPSLQMFSLPGAYLGVSPIEDQKWNIACLADMKKIDNKDPQSYIHNLIKENKELTSLLSQGNNLFDQWMVATLPGFGVKKTPSWKDVYFIGDAAVTVPPACGDGLSMAIIGGALAADYAIKKEPEQFKKHWSKRCGTQMFWAKLLHHLMMNPSLLNPMIQCANLYPKIANQLFYKSRT